MLRRNHWSLLYAISRFCVLCPHLLSPTGRDFTQSLTEQLRMSVTSLLSLNYTDPLSRISGMRRQIQSFIITMFRLAGDPIGGMENRYASCLLSGHFRRCSCLSQMWETAERAGLITANLMWFVSQSFYLCDRHDNLARPGPPQTLSGASPTYFVPWAVCTFIFDFKCYQGTFVG